jgi:hypothetical protein
MTANLTDKLQKVAANTVTTLASPGKSVGASSINVATTANFPTTTGITIAIRTVDNNGELVAGTYTEFTATVASGTSFTIDPTPVLGTDQIYPAGSTTQVYMPVSSSSYNKMIDCLLEEHGQNGKHVIVGGAGVGVGNSSLNTTAGDIGGAWKSCDLNPQGFSSVTTATGLYTQIGKTIHLYAYITGTSNSINFTFTIPATVANTFEKTTRVNNNGNTSMGMVICSDTTATVYTSDGGVVFTASGTKTLYANVLTYQAA